MHWKIDCLTNDHGNQFFGPTPLRHRALFSMFEIQSRRKFFLSLSSSFSSSSSSSSSSSLYHVWITAYRSLAIPWWSSVNAPQCLFYQDHGREGHRMFIMSALEGNILWSIPNNRSQYILYKQEWLSVSGCFHIVCFRLIIMIMLWAVVAVLALLYDYLHSARTL